MASKKNPKTPIVEKLFPAPKRKKTSQQSIPGTERKVHADIREAAEDYVEIRDERQAMTVKEVDAKSKLMGLLKKHKLESYVDEDAEIEVEIVPIDETVKVRKWKPKPLEQPGAPS
jgi:hypothetical protein